MKVIIMSGIPGSGKTFKAKRYIRDARDSAVIVSADDFHTDYKGKYDFKLENAGLSHQNCFRGFMNAIWADMDLIIVDNTNLTVGEIAPYYMAGEAFYYEVEIHRVDRLARAAFGRQQHNVPKEIHDKMQAQFNKCDVLPWWTVIEV